MKRNDDERSGEMLRTRRTRIRIESGVVQTAQKLHQDKKPNKTSHHLQPTALRTGGFQKKKKREKKIRKAGRGITRTRRLMAVGSCST
jgi:hypothetical protein